MVYNYGLQYLICIVQECMVKPSLNLLMETIMKLLLATGNSHKAQEIASILKSHMGESFSRLTLLTTKDLPAHESPVEDGETFLENALKKGRYYAEMGGYLTLADDSGLQVKALGGRPGLYSSRYAPTDKERISKLLEEMSGFPAEQRVARFICTAVLVFPGKGWTGRVGYCHGRIITEARGTHGFGFDPVFFLPDHGKTMAELSMEEKNRVSHRANAVEQLVVPLNKVIDLASKGLDNTILELFDDKVLESQGFGTESDTVT
jgi:XTP/dITP diphosphohydrolase